MLTSNQSSYLLAMDFNGITMPNDLVHGKLTQLDIDSLQRPSRLEPGDHISLYKHDRQEQHLTLTGKFKRIAIAHVSLEDPFSLQKQIYTLAQQREAGLTADNFFDFACAYAYQQAVARKLYDTAVIDNDMTALLENKSDALLHSLHRGEALDMVKMSLQDQIDKQLAFYAAHKKPEKLHV